MSLFSNKELRRAQEKSERETLSKLTNEQLIMTALHALLCNGIAIDEEPLIDELYIRIQPK